MYLYDNRSAVAPPPPVTVDAWVIFDVRSGTALDAKSSNGARIKILARR